MRTGTDSIPSLTAGRRKKKKKRKETSGVQRTGSRIGEGTFQKGKKKQALLTPGSQI